MSSPVETSSESSSQNPDQPEPADAATGEHGHGKAGPGLVLASIGVVYGDIGTSPLYALRESLAHAHEEGLAETAVIGIVSLLLWTVMLIVTVKYVILILRADNNGEGGTLSLVAKAQGALGGRRAWWLYLTGIVGVSLFFGDSMITPAISVLSAVEGLTLVMPDFERWVVPATLAIVIVLFWVQRSGTGAVARFFGPITLVWFLTMGVLGASHIMDDARILNALNPLYAADFLIHNGFGALPVLGSVFLAVTGAEALYADMGHFGRRAIRIAWTAVVLPALALAYLGQGAMVLSHPETAVNPFFLMAPGWFTLPLVILATMATVIASQAVISGAFSVAAQAVQLGLLPRLDILHTSDQQAGQIFLPRVNTILLMGVCALVIGFGSSARLASAYGIAVTGDMVITSLLAIVVFRFCLALALAGRAGRHAADPGHRADLFLCERHEGIRRRLDPAGLCRDHHHDDAGLGAWHSGRPAEAERRGDPAGNAGEPDDHIGQRDPCARHRGVPDRRPDDRAAGADA